MKVTKIVEADISEKIDIDYIADQFPQLKNIGVTFICTRGGGEEDQWLEEETGWFHIVIQLPYEEIRQMEDVRPLMLEKTLLRLRENSNLHDTNNDA